MIMSATSGRLDVVRLLLDSKADIHASNKVPQLTRESTVSISVGIDIDIENVPA